MMEQSDNCKKEQFRFKRDETGHRICHLCDFKPKATKKHPDGNPATLHYHLKKKHNGDCEHVCQECGYAFLHKLQLDTHMASRHPEKTTQVKMFKCDLPDCCYESFTLGNLIIHKARNHYNDIAKSYLQTRKVDNNKIYSCSCCQNDFNSPTSYYHHIMKCVETNNEILVFTA